MNNFTHVVQKVCSFTNIIICTPVAKYGFPYSDFHEIRHQRIGLQLCRHLVQNFIPVLYDS